MREREEEREFILSPIASLLRIEEYVQKRIK